MAATSVFRINPMLAFYGSALCMLMTLKGGGGGGGGKISILLFISRESKKLERQKYNHWNHLFIRLSKR